MVPVKPRQRPISNKISDETRIFYRDKEQLVQVGGRVSNNKTIRFRIMAHFGLIWEAAVYSGVMLVINLVCKQSLH